MSALHLFEAIYDTMQFIPCDPWCHFGGGGIMDRRGFGSKSWLQKPRCLELLCSSLFQFVSMLDMEPAVRRTHIEKGKASLELVVVSWATLRYYPCMAICPLTFDGFKPSNFVACLPCCLNRKLGSRQIVDHRRYSLPSPSKNPRHWWVWHDTPFKPFNNKWVTYPRGRAKRMCFLKFRSEFYGQFN